MDDNENKFENFSNFNKSKRIQLVERYSKAESLNLETEAQFEHYILGFKFPHYDENENLIETLIRYSVLYLEEFNYDLKQTGLTLLDHLMANTSPSVLNLNMRSKLVLTSFEKYINDKEGPLVYLDKQMQSMLKLLNIIESTHSSSQHSYKQHSLILDSILNNAYMTTNTAIKEIYFKNIQGYVKQMNVYACRHLGKLLTVGFDCGLDNSNLSFNFVERNQLCVASLDLIECILSICWLRIHAHSKEIINFLLKLVYFACLEEEDQENLTKPIIERITCMLKRLFTNAKLANQEYEEFNTLKQNRNLNSKFLNIIQHI